MGRACCATNKSSHNTNQVFLQQVLSRFGACVKCLIDQGSEFRGKFQYLLNHALIDHHRISRDHPKLMALQKGWFKHARRDFGIYASLGTKRIGTWPYLTSPWVTGCPNIPLCLISLLIFYFLGNIPFHPLPLLLKWTKLSTWTPQPLGLESLQRRLFYLGGLCPWPWRTCPLHNIETLYDMHTHEVTITKLK